MDIKVHNSDERMSYLDELTDGHPGGIAALVNFLYSVGTLLVLVPAWKVNRLALQL
ncbi:hypothetical protein P175DRAFT_0498887 [Aspergillus ochraceoroseus IBT 24754]|uniref:Uncharacterized protein n=1 Tax=Aspergillus ochraceoroseus IBT 24754 TaxID=1392256 RepID=A0A2T5M1E3_9EURO|nr:uncharacterized protein P175DRAFT_0498887 [Aspergillus ochraceoroseus IBT 24754]PTU22354.1 hypothetical protein P175DRAFT_0498887 [Aspergillus ochraceoroseus IBT 24754]